MKRAYRFAACGLLVCLFFSCASAPPLEEEPPLFGMIYDYDNRPVSGVSVSIDGTVLAQSDVNGRFTLAALSLGHYEFEFLREGYETARSSFDYSDPAQVVYAKMVSADQLLSAAEGKIEERYWGEAAALIDRSLAVRPNYPVARYLKAVVRSRTGDDEGARTILEGLLSEEYREPAIYLFLADLCQYRLEEPEAARAYLESYLRLRYDPEAAERLRELGGR